jgi:peptide subunit release factor 1 (eRF1)
VIAPYPPPVLSLYLDVNPANPDNARKAYVLRAREVLAQQGVPKEYAQEILTRLKLEHVIPQGRTLVVFAGGDHQALFESFYLQTEIPLLELRNGAVARWGVPYVTPLLVALDEQERYGVIYLDQERWRYFEVYLGEIEELQDAFRAVNPEAWRDLTEGQTGTPPGVPARGGAGKDKFNRRLEAWTQRFYKEVAELLKQTVAERSPQRLILIGPFERLQAFEEVLPTAIRGLIVDRLPPPPHPALPASEVLALVMPSIERAEREHERRLLAELRERGIHGVEAVLDALQAGRLYVLAVPWRLDQTVYRCQKSGLLVATEASAAMLCPDEPLTEVLFKDILPELAAQHGVKLEFVRGEAEAALNELGGMAGLPRW